MIEKARENGEGICFKQGDCENLPYPDNSFDVISCSMSFHHYPHADLFFKSVKRVLKPNGRLILRDMSSSSKLLMWATNHIELPLANRFLKKGDVHCYTKEDVQKLCSCSGLKLENFEIRKGLRLHALIRKRGE